MIVKEPLPDFVVNDGQIAIYPSNKMTVFHSKQPTHVLKGTHKHTNYEFVIARSPINGFVRNGMKMNLAPGDVAGIQSGQLHGTELLLTEVEFTNIQFEREFLQDVMYELYQSRSLAMKEEPVRADLSFMNLIQQYIDEYDKKESGYLLVLKQLSITIAVALLRMLIVQQEKGKGDIHKILDYMKENLECDFSLDQISNHFKMSKSSVIRKFKESMGITPYDFFLELKMGRALELLNEPKNRVIDVALQCGFTNHSHFSSVFKKATGLTPTEYREKVLHVK